MPCNKAVITKFEKFLFIILCLFYMHRGRAAMRDVGG